MWCHTKQMTSPDYKKIAEVFGGCADEFKRVEQGGVECQVYYPTTITWDKLKQFKKQEWGDVIMYTDAGDSMTLRFLRNRDTAFADASLKRYQEKSKRLSMNSDEKTPTEVRAVIYNMLMDLPIDETEDLGHYIPPDAPGGLFEVPMFLPFDGQVSIHTIQKLVVDNNLKDASVQLREDETGRHRLCVVCIVAAQAPPSRKRARTEEEHPAATRARWSHS